MIVRLELHLPLQEALESEHGVDVCPLCSRIEDHWHRARLLGDEKVADELDGEPMREHERCSLMAMVRGD